MLILFEDTQIIAIHKAAGWSFHQEGDNPSIIDRLRSFKTGQYLTVHRLDKVTSGVLLFAKNQVAAAGLGDLFQTHKIQKEYIALSDKKPKKKQGNIKGDIVKSRSSQYKLTRDSENPSFTSFKSYPHGEQLRLFHLKPKTGKTHQIRVVMKSLGSPILGDTLYSGTSTDRVYLHCYRMSFNFNEKNYDIKSDLFEGEKFKNLDLSLLADQDK